MPVYQRGFKKELRRLDRVLALLDRRAAHFGVNKTREVSRLLYEISKREGAPPESIIPCSQRWDYKSVKDILLKRRFSQAGFYRDKIKPFLPSIDLKSAYCADIRSNKFYPRRIFIEKKVINSSLAKRFKKAFPKAVSQEIKSFREHRRNNAAFSIEDYNRRRDTIFIVSQKHDFFKRCPCTKGAQRCGYHIFNLGFGCIYECTYCYLQSYANSPGIILPANIERFFDAFNAYKKPGLRLGTGEFSDSLMLDAVTGYSEPIISFFKKHPQVLFEFKTKSANVENLLKCGHGGNIIVSWSLNPQKVIDENEFFSAFLKERLEAASKCVRAGYRIGFHFDPIIDVPDSRRQYSRVVELMFKHVEPKQIAWISLGTFRFPTSLKQIIEARFPVSKILNGELLLGYDAKLRYPYRMRLDLYRFMIKAMQKFSKNLPIYLCMEEFSMQRELNLKWPFDNKLGG